MRKCEEYSDFFGLKTRDEKTESLKYTDVYKLRKITFEKLKEEKEKWKFTGKFKFSLLSDKE